MTKKKGVLGVPKPAQQPIASPLSQAIPDEPTHTLVSLVKSGYNRPNIDFGTKWPPAA
ncbi:MAG: hypothetical protein ABSA23_02325 [Anaerolineales bacterium]|jgi:hypothetical protein